VKLWPLIRFSMPPPEYRVSQTHHHEPQKWKARPDFKWFDCSFVKTEGCVPTGAPIPRPWSRIWLYWKKAGVIQGWHIDWIWFPNLRSAPTVTAPQS
jgi:hypothetical protein